MPESGFTKIEDKINEAASKALNKAGDAANKAAEEHIQATYNTKIRSGAIKIRKATKENLTFKIEVKGGPVSLLKKVVSTTNTGVTVLVKKSPKFIRGAFVAPWQKKSKSRFVFLNTGKRRRRSLYTIGLKSMYKSRATITVLKKAFLNNFKSAFNLK